MLWLSKNTDMERRRIAKLVEDNERLVHWIIGRFFPHFLKTEEYHDVVQAGLVALWNCAKRYDKDFGCRTTEDASIQFSTFATRAILQAIVRHRILMNRRGFSGGNCEPRVASLNSLADRTDLSLDHMLADKEENYVDRDGILHYLNQLHPRIREVIWLRYFESMTLSQIANKLDISKERIRQIQQFGLERLARMMRRSGEESV